jgi:hypothetical protein
MSLFKLRKADFIQDYQNRHSIGLCSEGEIGLNSQHSIGK